MSSPTQYTKLPPASAYPRPTPRPTTIGVTQVTAHIAARHPPKLSGTESSTHSPVTASSTIHSHLQAAHKSQKTKTRNNNPPHAVTNNHPPVQSQLSMLTASLQIPPAIAPQRSSSPPLTSVKSLRLHSLFHLLCPTEAASTCPSDAMKPAMPDRVPATANEGFHGAPIINHCKA
ncbi:UNVERIFIED_CONTAM: hypothetical protein HHA_453690 [Hammondia hammondi]|eukprot:XP_008886946.1 hypothetical protein HHA_453690 [Hammondia hammondi]